MSNNINQYLESKSNPSKNSELDLNSNRKKGLNKLVIFAWIPMLLASSLTLIFWREFSSGEPFWWPWVVAVSLIIFLLLSFIISKLKSLRKFYTILIIIFFVGFGGGWQWGLIPFIRDSLIWNLWLDSLPWAFSSIMIHILRLSPAILVLVYLTLLGRKRQDYFLIKGNIKALVEPSKLLGMKEPEPWTRIGSIFAVIFAVGTLIFLIFTTLPTLETFVNAVPLIPVALLIATINAFNEEFTLRAAPLSELWQELGKKQALLITTIYFGLGHYYGVPNGIIGVLLSAFLGWFIGKSLLETKGFFWAWFLHFASDAIIFTFYAMSI
ncbi:MAG: CPBP family intramembrane glutamic endopeptidase [Candidatus Thorarchaeota archaeon]